MFIVAVASMVLSFDGLRKLATEASISDQLAFLFPVIVDGTIIMASLSILRMNLSGQKAVLGWVTMIMGTGLSIAGNVISVRNEGIIAMGTHALPPILLATSLELFLSLIRTNIKLAQDAQEAEVKIQEAAQNNSATPLPAIPVEEPKTPAHTEIPTSSVEPVKESENLVVAPTVNKEEEKPSVQPEEPVIYVPVAPPVFEEKPLPELPAEEEQIETESTGPKIVFETVFAPSATEHAEESPVDTETVDITVPEISEEIQKPVVGPSNATTEAAPEPEIKNDISPAEAPVKKPVRKAAAKPDNEHVVNYKKILEKLKPESSQKMKIAAILSRYPEAKPVDMKRAIGDPANARYDEPIKQARAFLEQRAQQKQKTQ